MGHGEQAVKRIPQCEPSFGAEEASAVAEYMASGGWLTEHTKTAVFESLIASYTGARHCIVVPNGTLSLTLAALALGIGPGDEVIVPDYTMIASANAFAMLGATPVFVDVVDDSLCLDLGVAAMAITPRTKAIVLVTANGRCPIAPGRLFSKAYHERGISLIEDAAQSLGSRFHNGRHCGRHGIAGSFSFSTPKIVSTGQGGAVITDDDDLAMKMRRIKDFGRASGGTDVHDTIGFNFKFTDLQAVVGIEQMKKLPRRVTRKRQILTRYWNALADVAQVQFFPMNLDYQTPWFVDVLVQRRAELQAHLAEHGIGTRVMYPPIHAQKAYARPGSFPVAERVGRDGLWLPSSVTLTDDDIDRVCEEIRVFYGGKR
jgi:perosamine synthetase